MSKQRVNPVGWSYHSYEIPIHTTKSMRSQSPLTIFRSSNVYVDTSLWRFFFDPVNVTYFLDLALLSLLLAAVVSSDRRRNSTEHKPQGNLVSGDWVE